jgi:hypothetical protein
MTAMQWYGAATTEESPSGGEGCFREESTRDQSLGPTKNLLRKRFISHRIIVGLEARRDIARQAQSET